MVFGSRSDPGHVVARLGATLADAVDLDDLVPGMEAAIRQGLGVEWARIRLDDRDGGDGDVLAALVVPIVHDGEHLGTVEVGSRPHRPLDDDDTAVLTTLAGQAALAVRNVRLAHQLRAHATELASSRTRLLRAQETERRRIERDLHDGVQQGLVALIAHAGRVRRQLDRVSVDGGTAAVSLDIDELQSGLKRVLHDLRELASGIHPTLLTDRGLLAAVESLAARTAVPVVVTADHTLRGTRLPPEVEGACYFTVAEALANSQKHASAASITVSLRHVEDRLAICVSDDGVGFDPARTPLGGQGLGNLSDRISALGGRFDVDGRPGEGTRVTAEIAIDGSG